MQQVQQQITQFAAQSVGASGSGGLPLGTPAFGASKGVSDVTRTRTAVNAQVADNATAPASAAAAKEKANASESDARRRRV